ncbi:MAG: DUF1501 domain-containing protein [Pirellulales bacterium]
MKTYELAFRMQTAVPEVIDFDHETAATQKLYGLDNPTTRPFGMQLRARGRAAAWRKRAGWPDRP